MIAKQQQSETQGTKTSLSCKLKFNLTGVKGMRSSLSKAVARRERGINCEAELKKSETNDSKRREAQGTSH